MIRFLTPKQVEAVCRALVALGTVGITPDVTVSTNDGRIRAIWKDDDRIFVWKFDGRGQIKRWHRYSRIEDFAIEQLA